MQPKNELYGIWDKKERTLIFTYRTGAGNVKKALFNNRKRAERVIEDISFWKDRAIEDFKVVKIGGAADVDRSGGMSECEKILIDYILNCVSSCPFADDCGIDFKKECVGLGAVGCGECIYRNIKKLEV